MCWVDGVSRMNLRQSIRLDSVLEPNALCILSVDSWNRIQWAQSYAERAFYFSIKFEMLLFLANQLTATNEFKTKNTIVRHSPKCRFQPNSSVPMVLTLRSSKMIYILSSFESWRKIRFTFSIYEWNGFHMLLFVSNYYYVLLFLW